MGGDKLKNPEKYFKDGRILQPERTRRYLGYNGGDKLSSLFDFIPSGIYLGSDHKSSNLDDFDENIECSSGMIKQSTTKTANDLLDSLDLTNENENGGGAGKYLSMIRTDVYDSFCSSLHCDVGPMSKDETAIIRLRFRLWSRSLAIVSRNFKEKTYLI